MKCIVCDLTSVEVDSEAEDDISLTLISRRSLLLSIFCKYFNWANNCDLTPGQILSWIPTSDTSGFPFCTKCEIKMNDLNELHDNLTKIQLEISTIIASMSMEIIKVADSFSHKNKNPKELKSVGDFRHHVYKQFKPLVILQDCKETKNLETSTTRRRKKIKRPYLKKLRKDAEKEEQAVKNMTVHVIPNFSYKNEDEEELLLHSPDCPSNDEDNIFDKNYYPDAEDGFVSSSSADGQFEMADDPINEEDKESSSAFNKNLEDNMDLKEEEQDEEYTRRGKPRKVKRKRQYKKRIRPRKQRKEEANEEDVQTSKNSDSALSLFPNTNLARNKSPYEKETFPGSNIFLYLKWEYCKVSDTAYKCQTCGVLREKRTHIRMHIKRIHDDVMYNCNACGLKWSTQAMKDRHKCKPSPRRVKKVEEVSPGKFLYLKKFLYQKVDKNSNEEGLEFMCLNGTCRKLTRLSDFMLVHMRQCHDDLQLVCEICGKTKTSPSLLREHMLTHSEARNIICDICGKSFKTRKCLRTHRPRHQGGFVCGFQGCTKSYGGLSGLIRHRKDANHPAEKKLHKIEQCPHCSRTFVGEERLARHISSLKCIIHQVKCQFCSKEMKPKTMKLHLRKYCPLNPEFPEHRVKNYVNLSRSEDDNVDGEDRQQPSSQPEIKE